MEKWRTIDGVDWFRLEDVDLPNMKTRKELIALCEAEGAELPENPEIFVEIDDNNGIGVYVVEDNNSCVVWSDQLISVDDQEDLWYNLGDAFPKENSEIGLDI